ncbi:MAG: ferrous iron transport protein A [Planctomycetaceae bacterium]
MSIVIPLESLAVGESARIENVDGSIEMVTRLEEMGLRQGVDIQMVRPGSPCIIALNNHRISFRGEESAIVMVAVTEKKRI